MDRRNVLSEQSIELDLRYNFKNLYGFEILINIQSFPTYKILKDPTFPKGIFF